MTDIQMKLRKLPAIERLMQVVAENGEFDGVERKVVIEALRKALECFREQIRQGGDPEISVEGCIQAAREKISAILVPSLRRVINATGVILHTNLGRAPLSQRAQNAVSEVMKGYSTLEYDLKLGQRGSRYSHVAGLICSLTGAEDALVVNNNAAAVVLAISAIARDREVIVSRGELVEIGGSFRIPDVIRQSGAKLVEVGTTNKTHLSDYRQAVNGETAALLKVHTSNYRIVGFTAQPEPADLVALGREIGLPVIEDLGSGTMLPLDVSGWHEPSVAERIAAGFNVVTFSGDKLFGAGQAGIIAGDKQYIDIMKKHPLLRAFRIDKLSLASLEGTLMDYIYGSPARDIPVQAMLNLDSTTLKSRADQLQALIKQTVPGWQTGVVKTLAPAGGGSLPAADLPGYGVTVYSDKISASVIEQRLRSRTVPVIVRVQEDHVLFDIRCLAEGDYRDIADACAEIAKGVDS